MHNATMRDKLTAAMGSTGEISLPFVKVRIKPSGKPEVLHRQPRPYMADRKKTLESNPVPLIRRYTTPPKKSKPFAVHTYPALSKSETLPEKEAPVPCEETPKKTLEISVQEETAISAAEVSTPAETSLPAPVVVVSVPEETKESLSQEEVSPGSIKEEIVPLPEVAPVVPAVPVQPAPAVPLPPDLSWLQKPTPFAGDLQNIVGHIRDAKTQIAFTCEQLRMREIETRKRLEQAQKDMDSVQFELMQQKDYVQQLNDMLAACALVAEQSAGIAPDLFSKIALHKKPYKMQENPGKGSRNSNDPTICRRRDILPLFEAEPTKNWNCAALREALPEIKREHARISLSVMLSGLAHEGILQRVVKGVYCKAV